MTVDIMKMQVLSVLVKIFFKCTQDFILSALYRSNWILFTLRNIWLVIVPYSYSENGKTNTIHIQWNLSSLCMGHCPLFRGCPLLGSFMSTAGTAGYTDTLPSYIYIWV